MDALTKHKLQVSELREMQSMMDEELRLFNELAKNAGESGFMARLKVRTTFACIEAGIYHLRGSALLFSDDPHATFSREEYLALHEQREEKKQGIVAIKKAKISMKDNLKLALSCLAKALNHSFKPDFGSTGGKAFLRAIEIRDRIVHPHTASDWKVSDADLKIIDEAWAWYGEQRLASFPAQE